MHGIECTPCLWSDDAVGDKAVCPLKLAHRDLGVGPEDAVGGEIELELDALHAIVLHAAAQCGSADLRPGRPRGLDRWNEYGRRRGTGDDASHGRPEGVHVEAWIVLAAGGQRGALGAG